MSNGISETIFIGKKPLMTCVTTVIIQLAIMPIITIKAREFSIGTTVDLEQIVLRKTNPTFMIGDIKIASESLVSTDRKNRNISTIEISLKRTLV